MTRDKDRKRLVRARMKRTGESYTAARAVVVTRKTRSGEAGRPAASPPDGRTDDETGRSGAHSAGGLGAYAAPRAQWAALAGMADAAVKAKTGRDWAGWVALLDRAGAQRMSHRDIARHLATVEGVAHWWSQTLTVGYERIRGLRDVGQRRDGAYEASKSRTYPVAVSKLYRMFADTRSRRTWLPEGIARVRTASADKSMRVDWHDGTQVHFYFLPKGPAKSTLAVQHVKLARKADVEREKTAWAGRLDDLGAALAPGAPGMAGRTSGAARGRGDTRASARGATQARTRRKRRSG